MSDTLEILVFPQTPPETVARALAVVPGSGGDLSALILPVPMAAATVARFYDAHGRQAALDLTPYAAALSRGGHALGVVRIDPVGNTRRWAAWRDGAQAEVYTPDDELYVPHDEDGLPDLEAPPVRARDGVPAGYRRLRSALDLGMQKLVSCRFTPVAHAVERLGHAEAPDARAWVLRRGGRDLRPPQEQRVADLFGG